MHSEYRALHIKLRKLSCRYLDNGPKADVELEYYGCTGTLAFKYTGWPSHPDIVCSTSYLRSITQKLALGSQLTFRYFVPPEPNQKLSDITYYAWFVLKINIG